MGMKLTGRFYSGKLIQAEYTTVSDFREARCRAFHETRCNRGAYCNFMHIKHIPRAIKRRVVREMYDDHPEYLGPAQYIYIYICTSAGCRVPAISCARANAV